MSSPQTFVPPSPGQWELYRTHATKAMSGFAAAVFGPSFSKGFKEAMAAYGVLLDSLEPTIINGFFYMTPRPVGAPLDAKGHPPRPVFWVLTKVHPEIRKRIRTSAVALAEKRWRKELQWWDDEVKPQIAREGQALLAEDLTAASNLTLSDHLRRATDFAGRTIYFHHRMNGCALIPPADFLVHAMAWTGEPPEVVLGALRGASPLSAGATQEIVAVRAAVNAEPAAQALLASGRSPRDVLAALDELPSVQPALRAYLDVAGWRVLGGYDVADEHARERPDVLLNVIKAEDVRTVSSRDGASAMQALRSKVPATHQAEFDALLAEAMLTYRVRDERNFCSDAIGTGVARRAILAAGARLQEQGKVKDARHLIDATPDEIQALLEGREGPSAEELAARTTRRLASNIDDMPDRLGIPPSPPPPAEWLPPAAARVQRAIDLTLRLMFAVPEKQEGRGQQLKGFAVSPGVIEGPARVIHDVSELPSVQDGEILVTPSTGPTFNLVLPLLRGIVTERGGALSHAAIVAREYGIPAVVGCRDATKRITTGQQLRVDGVKEDVWIIA